MDFENEMNKEKKDNKKKRVIIYWHGRLKEKREDHCDPGSIFNETQNLFFRENNLKYP